MSGKATMDDLSGTPRLCDDARSRTAGCACAWEGCASAGEYRAPKDRRLQEYLVFCLEHVRAYNANWDYHKGYSADQLEEEIRSAATWERPTWKLGTLGAGYRPGHARVHDPFGFAAGTAFDPDGEPWDQRDQRAGHRTGAGGGIAGVRAERANALKVLQLTWPVTLAALKQRYKALVKKYHPDANGGSSEAETRMKIINQAYQTLRAALS